MYVRTYVCMYMYRPPAWLWWDKVLVFRVWFACIFPHLTITDAQKFKDAFERCQAALATNEEDTLAQEMTKLKVESTQDSATDQQEKDESGGSEKKETTSQEKNAESNTDTQPSSEGSVATAEDSKPPETKWFDTTLILSTVFTVIMDAIVVCWCILNICVAEVMARGLHPRIIGHIPRLPVRVRSGLGTRLKLSKHRASWRTDSALLSFIF